MKISFTGRSPTSTTGSNMRLIVTALAAALLLSGCDQPQTQKVTGPLAITVEELCTRCVEVLKCEGTGIPAAVYVMDEKSFWGQIATIWDYLIQMVRPKSEDFRQTTRYGYTADGQDVTGVTTGQTRLDVWNRRIELPDTAVDQKTGAWTTRSGEPLGSCVKLDAAAGATMARTLKKLDPIKRQTQQ